MACVVRDEEPADGGQHISADVVQDSRRYNVHSYRVPEEISSFIFLESDSQYLVIREDIENYVRRSFPALQIHLEPRELKLIGSPYDLPQAREFIKRALNSVKSRTINISQNKLVFLSSWDKKEISEKIFHRTTEGHVILDTSRGLHLYAISNTLLDQAEQALQEDILEEVIEIKEEMRVVTFSEQWEKLLENIKSNRDLLCSRKDGNGGLNLSLVGFKGQVQTELKKVKDHMNKHTLIEKEFNLEHRVFVEHLDDLLQKFHYGTLYTDVKTSPPPGNSVTLIGTREMVTSAFHVLEKLKRTLLHQNVSIPRHGAMHFFMNQSKELFDKMLKNNNCQVYLLYDFEGLDNEQDGNNREECMGRMQRLPPQNRYSSRQKVETLKMTGNTASDKTFDNSVVTNNEKSDKRSLGSSANIKQEVQLTLSYGNLEVQKADVFVAPLLASNPVLTAMHVTRDLQQKAGPRFSSLFSTFINGCSSLSPGSLVNLPVSGDCYAIKCDRVVFIVCSPWDGPDGNSAKALRKGISNFLETCQKNVSSVAMSTIGAGLALRFPKEVAARIFGEEIKSFVEREPNASLKRIQLVFQEENQILFLAYRDTLSAMDLGDRIVLCNEEGRRFIKPSFGESTHMKVGSLAVSVVYGSIVSESTDAIVNSTNFTTWNQKTVAHAIFTSAGPEVVQEAQKGIAMSALLKIHRLVPGPVCHTVSYTADAWEVGGRGDLYFSTSNSSGKRFAMTGSGALACNWIFHYDCQKEISKIEMIVGDVLLKCEELGLHSVAIPAFGTGQCMLDPIDVAKCMKDAIFSFACNKKLSSLSCVRLITYQPYIFSIFCMELKGRFKSVPQSSWNECALLTTRLKYRQVPEIEAKKDIEIFESPIPHPPAALLTIVGLQRDKVEATKHDLKTAFDQQYREEKIEEPLIASFSLDEIQDLLSMVKEKPDVQMILDRKNKCIFLNGCYVGVKEVLVQVQSKLRAILHARLDQSNRERAGLLVQWGYASGESLVPFKEDTSLLLEERYLAGNKGVLTVALEDGKKAKVNLETMKASVDGSPEVIVVRKDLELETDLPTHWNAMKGQFLFLVQLDHNTDEYKKVQVDFTRTTKNLQIVKIERIQNKYQFIAYMLRKKCMIERNGYSEVNERTLYHGTAPHNCNSINFSGFNRSFAGQKDTACGNGLCFAVDASYSASVKYSPPDPETDERNIYQVKVLTGRSTKAQHGLKALPCRMTNDPFDYFDSFVDNKQKPVLFVVFDNDQVYPEYLITFKG